MIKCPRCGKENDDDAVFCKECGYNLKQQEDSGLLAALKIIFAILLAALLLPVMLLVSMTLVGFLLYFFILTLSRGPSIFYIILTVIFLIPVFLSIPYWKRVYALRSRLEQGYGIVFKYALKWFLKGPFAYKDLKAAENKS